MSGDWKRLGQVTPDVRIHVVGQDGTAGFRLDRRKASTELLGSLLPFWQYPLLVHVSISYRLCYFVFFKSPSPLAFLLTCQPSTMLPVEPFVKSSMLLFILLSKRKGAFEALVLQSVNVVVNACLRCSVMWSLVSSACNNAGRLASTCINLLLNFPPWCWACCCPKWCWARRCPYWVFG